MMGMGDTVRRTHLAAFLIGGVMGVMAEMAAGLILYEGSGLLRATTVVLTTEAAAAGAGLLFATRVPVDEISRHLRHTCTSRLALGLAGILTRCGATWRPVGGAGGQAAALALLRRSRCTVGSGARLVCRRAAATEGAPLPAAGPRCWAPRPGF